MGSSAIDCGRRVQASAAWVRGAVGGVCCVAAIGLLGSCGTNAAPEQESTGGGTETSSPIDPATPLVVQTQDKEFKTITGIWARFDDSQGTPLELGAPLEDARDEPGGGQSMRFAQGTVFWTRATGAKIVRGEILNTYLDVGGPGGDLGYPVSDEASTDGAVRSEFEHGAIELKDAAIRVEYVQTPG